MSAGGRDDARRSGRDGELFAWVLVAGLATVAIWLGLRMATWPDPGWARLPALVIGMVLAVATATEAPVNLKGHLVAISPANCVVTLGIVYLPGRQLMVTVAAGVLAMSVACRLPAVKAAFNVVNHAVAVALSAEVYFAVLHHASPASLRGWAAIAAAAAVFDLTTTAAILLVVRLQNALDLRRLVAFVFPLLLAPAVNVVLSIVAVDAVWSNRWSLLPAALVPAGAMVGHRYYTRLSGRFANLGALYSFTQRLAGLAEEREVLTAILSGMLDALSCSVAQLVIFRDGAVICYEMRPGGQIRIIEPHHLPAVAEMAREEGSGVLLARGAKGEHGDALAAHGFHEAIAAGLPVENGETRVLIVADRLGDGSFGRDELRFVETLAAQGAVALRGTRLFDELRSEMASREHEALHDPLTQLGNRALFMRRTKSALVRRPGGTRVGVMLMDLDGFKEINDTLGHPTGDLVLKEVAQRLLVTIGDQGVPTRLGGDEFAIVVPALGAIDEVVTLARAVSEAISEPMSIGSLSLSVSASIGISVCPDHGTDTAALLKRADVAMYIAKGSGNYPVVYDPANDQNTTRRLTLATELRAALAGDALDLYFQPKVDMQTGQLLGFEALLRWFHPALGNVSPTEFIPVAEQAGLIDQLTWWVLARALQEQHRWSAHGFDGEVAVNVSARSLLDASLPDRLRELLEYSGADPQRLTLEVTETSVMADTQRSAAILHQAAAIGIRLAIDDFGTGYSSLSRLRELPVNEIKVDRSFVTTMLESADNLAIVASTINLALSLGRAVTAEGVEDLITWDALRQMGCHAAQGFVMAPPMPASEVLVWLDASSRTSRDHLSAVREVAAAPGAA